MKKYLITDPRFYPRFSLENRIARAYSRHFPDFMCLRDKTNRSYAKSAAKFLSLSRAFRSKFILHDRWKTAKKLKARGVHLSAGKWREIRQSARSGLLTIASCHSEFEIKRALRLGADFAAVSPIFASPGKGEPKGVEFIASLTPAIREKIIALGGITGGKEIAALENSGVFAFAAIRYFAR